MIFTVTPNPAIDRTIEVPRFRVGQLARGRAVGCMAAGKGVNVARILAALAEAPVVTGFLGKNESHLYAQSLPDCIRSEFVLVQGTTRCNTTILDPEDQTETHIREEGFCVAAEDRDRLTQRLDTLLHEGDLVAFCGSLPPGVEPKHLAHWVARYARKGCRVFVDAPGPALVHAVNARPYAIKPNQEELADLLRGIDGGIDALWNGVAAVLLSLGQYGGAFLSPHASWFASVPSLPKPVVNTVGCGDAFLAGCLFSAAKGQSPAEQIEAAVACGTAASFRPFAGEMDLADYKFIRTRIRARREPTSTVVSPDRPLSRSAGHPTTCQ